MSLRDHDPAAFPGGSVVTMNGGRQRQTRNAGETDEIPKARRRAGAGGAGGGRQPDNKPGNKPRAGSAGSSAGGSAAEPGSPAGGRGKLAGSWLGGVRSAGVDLGYPGERL